LTISATLTLQNQSDLSLTGLSAPDPKDGSLSSKPASTIGPRSSSSFDVKQNNSVSPGPEGTVTYDMSNGNSTWKVSFYWNYSSGPEHPENYTTSVSPACSQIGTPATSITDDSGDHHAVSYSVTYTPQAPQDWDLVWAMSLGLINSQLSVLMDQGLIRWQFTQPLTPGAAAGSDAAWPQLIVTTMDYPVVGIPDDATTHLTLSLPLTKATLQYLDGSTHQTLDLSGTTVVISLTLSQQPISDPSSLPINSSAKQQIQQLQSLNFGVYRLFADLRNPALFSSLKVIRTADGSSVPLDSSAQSTLTSTLGGLGEIDISLPTTATTKVPASTPQIVPTAFSPCTTLDRSNALYSSLNVCMMTRQRNLPLLATKFQFAAPLVPTDTSKGRLFLSQDTLGEGYVRPFVLPMLVNAANITTSTNIPSLITPQGSPLCYRFSASKNNGNLNGGRGQKVVVNNGFDQYVYATETFSFTTAPLTTLPGSQVGLSVSGSFQIVAEVNQYPLDTIGLDTRDPLGTNTYTQPWTATITLAAGESGKLLASISVSVGTLQSDSDSTLDGYISNFFDSLLGWTTTSPEQAIQQQMTTFVDTLAADFTKSADVNLSLSEYMILPTGGAYQYSAMQFDPTGAVRIDVAFPG